MHLSTEESPASLMVKLIGEVDGGVPGRSFSIKAFTRKNRSKTLQLEFLFFYFFRVCVLVVLQIFGKLYDVHYNAAYILTKLEHFYGNNEISK